MGVIFTPPPLPPEPSVVARPAGRQYRALVKKIRMRVQNFEIEVTCEVEVRSNVKIGCFSVAPRGDRTTPGSEPKLRQSTQMLGKVPREYRCHTEHSSGSRLSHERSTFSKPVRKKVMQCTLYGLFWTQKSIVVFVLTFQVKYLASGQGQVKFRSKRVNGQISK